MSTRKTLLGALIVTASLFWISLTQVWGGAKVSSGVYGALENNRTEAVYVIVMLRPVSLHTASLAQTKQAVAQVQNRVLQNMASDDFIPIYQYKTFAAITGYVSTEGLAALSVDPNVEHVGLDMKGHAHLSDSVPFIGADMAHAEGVTGTGVTVAVLDTGIDETHADLSDNIASGAWHFLDQGADTGPGAVDNNGHGTNVSGIITSRGTVAPLGVAPDADILPIKVLKDDGSGWVSDWAAGVDYVTANSDSYDNLCVINMSLGTSFLYSDCPCDNSDSFTMLLQASIAAAKAAGIVTFAASGNSVSCGSMSSPACLSAAVAVAAVYDQDLGREPDSGTYLPGCYDDPTFGNLVVCFSNRSACNALAAPGRMITSTGLNGGTSTLTGTSQAAPHCAGVAALMCETNCGVPLTPDQIISVMKDTGTATVDPCSETPHPISINAQAAVDAVLADTDDDGVLDECDNCLTTANPNQEDTYPPQGNDCGNACECEGNFDGDDDCDGTDASTFKTDFGRMEYDNPCNDNNPCNGDFDCDNDCDGTDASTFKADFGRMEYNNPCPNCVTDPWCMYP
jgi:subtilisin family serine protease